MYLAWEILSAIFTPLFGLLMLLHTCTPKVNPNFFQNLRHIVQKERAGETEFKMNMKSSLIFLLGVAMGTALGLLIAPEPGNVTLQKIKQEADRLADKVIEKKTVKEATAETV